MRHGVTERRGGVSPAPYASLNLGLRTGDARDNVLQNRERALSALGLERQQVRVGQLVHGAEVSVFRKGEANDDDFEETDSPDPVFHSDAAVSNVGGLHFMLTFADCVPLLFFDPVSATVGAAHAGWRGTAAGIARNVVNVMAHQFGARKEDIRVGIGPSIGPCCYAVDEQVIEEFAAHGNEAAMVSDHGAFALDLWQSNRKQLLGSGVVDENIETSGICTSCHVDRFFSHRRESGKTGRFALVAGLG